MRKKLIGVIAVGVCMLSLIGCGHEHTWDEATCTTPKTCSECGETEGETLGHTWEEATCTTAKTCSVCNEIEGAPLEHQWIEATLEAPKTCSVCNETEGEPRKYGLSDWLASEEAVEVIESVNEQLRPQGIQADILCDDSVLIFSYSFLEQMDMGGASKEEIYDALAQSVGPVLKDTGKQLVESFHDEYGVDITAFTVIICNFDGTEMYSSTVDSSELTD